MAGGRKSGGRRATDTAAAAGDGLEAPAVDPSPMFDEDPGESANVEEDLEEEEEEEEPAAAQLEYESEETTASGTESLTWISWFCSLPGHEYFAEVAEDFIEDDFNLTGLNSLVPFYKEALEMVLDVEPEESLKIPDVSIVESSAELLYGLIHQRYIITRMGLQQMVAKYEQAHFGYCPRVYCNTTKIVPCGRSDLPGVDTVKLFCPSCIDTYTPPSSRFSAVDGAFFGTTFPHLLFQTYQDLLPVLTPASARGQGTASPAPAPGESSPSTSPGPSGPPARRRPSSVPRDTADDDDVAHTTPSTSAAKIYIPRIYGFKVSERARSGPRMQWLRLRPRSETELERVDGQGRWRTAQPGGPDPASNSTATVERARPGQPDGFAGRAAVAPEDAALEEEGDAAEDHAAVARSPRSARPPQALPSVSRS